MSIVLDFARTHLPTFAAAAARLSRFFEAKPADPPSSMPPELAVTAEAMNQPSARPKGRDLFRKNAPRASHFTYPGKPTTVAAEKRRAIKRRNRLRHKAHLRRHK